MFDIFRWHERQRPKKIRRISKNQNLFKNRLKALNESKPAEVSERYVWTLDWFLTFEDEKVRKLCESPNLIKLRASI